MAVNVQTIVDAAVLLLNAADAATLTWWTEDELFGYANDAVQASDARLIGAYYDAETLTNGDADYDFPARHRGAIQIAIVGEGAVREATVREMEAEDPDWSTTAAGAGEWPTHWVGNWNGIGSFRFAPIPSDDGEWSIVQLEHPDAITSGSPTLDAPSVLGEWVLLSILRDAVRKESRGARPETAAYIDQMLTPLEDVITALWGA